MSDNNLENTTFYYGQKQKIKPIIKLRTPPLPAIRYADVKDNFSSHGYFMSTTSIANQINNHFGLESGQVDCQWYDDHFDDIAKFVLDNYTIRQHSGLTSKFASINAIMKAGNVDCSFIHKTKQLLQIPIEMQPAEKTDIMPWDDMLKYLKDQLTQTGLGSACCLLVTYLHGYALRLGDVKYTSIHKKNGVNWLDTENKMWYIRQDFTKQRKARQFPVTQEYIDELLPYVHQSGYLICKRNGNLYQNCNMKTLRLNVTVNDVRNSYETYNQSRKDIDQAEKSRISNDVLGHTTSIAIAHYTRNELANELKHCQ